MPVRYNQTTKCIKPEEVKGRFPSVSAKNRTGEENRWSNSGKEPFSEESLRYRYLLWMGLWRVLGFAKATVEVMLSGHRYRDIQADEGQRCCMSFFMRRTWCFLAGM